MNHTPEKHELPKPLPKPPCTWCISSHVAEITCKCPEPCGVGWCAAPSEEMSFRL
jgi:hypothetical protein